MALTMAATYAYAAASSTANVHAASDVTAAAENRSRSAGAAERYGNPEEL